MNQDQLEEFLIQTIHTFCDDNEIDLPNVNHQTRLMGQNGLFDSMDLVTFIVEVEEKIEDTYDISLTLTDEKAVSRHTSPFINISSLAKYIIETIDEN